MKTPDAKMKKLPGPRATALKAAIDTSIDDMRSKDAFVRRRAREALTKIGRRAVLPLLPLLEDPAGDVRWEAAKALVSIPDARAASSLVRALEDSTFGVRWLAAEGLIAMRRDGLATLLQTLIQRSKSVWLRGGAHHVLHDLARGELEELLAPVVAALDGMEPQVGVLGPATNALQALRK